MVDNNKDLFGILNDIVNGLKNVKLSGNIDLSQIKREYRSIFGGEYAEDENKEIIATSLNGRMKGIYPFLRDKGCCWIDFIGCDSFSNDYKKQIFFATVSINQKVYKKRRRFLSLYNNLLNKGIPIDIFVQLFFTNKDQFSSMQKQKRDASMIKKTLEKIQNDGFVIPLIEYDNNDLNEKKWSDKPLLIDIFGLRHIKTGKKACEQNRYYRLDRSFIKDVNKLKNTQNSSLALTDQLRMFLRTAGKAKKREDYSDLIKILTKFNKSLYPKGVNFLYFIPNHCPDGAVGLFCYGAKFLLCEKDLNEIKLLSYNILYPYMTSYKSAWEYQQIVNESIKSAVSAIMSRNMSHNLGSHYLYYTKSYLEQKAGEDGDIAPDLRGVAKVLSYLQSRMDFLATIISNDKYPYGPVNFKSQIFDELTIDDFSHRHFPDQKNKRTTNFLLTNLIRSENFTRDKVQDDVMTTKRKNRLYLKVKYSEDGENYREFSGSWDKEKLIEEQDLKNELSRLNLALPGGIMSSHAFFTVLENFIRNSAKYLRKDVSETEGLVFTVVVRPHSKSKESHLDIIFYDNKRNANKLLDDNSGRTLFSDMCERLGKLEIIDSSNVLAKEDKGLKEMLFSTIWMRTYNFKLNESFSDVLTKVNTENDIEKKLCMIENYGFTLVRVVDKGQNIKVFDRKEQYNGESNLGLLFTVPIYKTCQQLRLSDDQTSNEREMLNVMADVVEINGDAYNKCRDKCPDFQHIFTRVIESQQAKKESAYEKYKRAVEGRFKGISEYAICFEQEDGTTFQESFYPRINSGYKIYYMKHLDSKGDEYQPEDYRHLAYADTVSGGNYTITLEELFKNGIDESGTLKSDEDRMMALRIKESALTRITIIDERLFKTTKEDAFGWLSLKNIRLLNYDENSELNQTHDASKNNQVFTYIFKGNSFNKKKEYEENETHFLTIHLGLIEKILQNSILVNREINKRMRLKADLIPVNKLTNDRIQEFMVMLQDYFGKDAFISIHSGRGNFSKELDEALSKYPYISLSALENAFNNSKFQLSQLLYNTIYLRKKS